MLARRILIVTRQKVFIIFAILTVLICFGITGVHSETSKELFSDAVGVSDTDLFQTENDSVIVRSRYVNVNFDLIREETGIKDIILNLFYDVTYTASMERVEVRSAESYTWFGKINGIKHSQVILTVENGSMAGNITLHGRLFHIRPVNNRYHAVREIDQSAFTEEMPPVRVKSEHYDATFPEEIVPDDGSIIDVLVVYTPAAASASSDIAAEIQLGIDETNWSYDESGINQRLRLAHSAQVSYTESSDMLTDLYRLKVKTDGYMDNVHSLRDYYAADAVSLWIEGGDSCGIAFFMETVSLDFESSAFSVVSRSCATGYYSFGHELGHNMSAAHDWYVDSGVSPYPYIHGYVYLPGRWRTIMAYNTECSNQGFYCTRLQYWSNPEVLYEGVPMGVPEGAPYPADNRKTLNNTAYTVANFRVSTAVPDVSGNIKMSGVPLGDQEVLLTQTGELTQTAFTVADSSYKFLSIVSGKKFSVKIKGPVATSPDISGCIDMKGSPLIGSKVILKQKNELNKTTNTDTIGCYAFADGVIDKKFTVLIKGPGVP